jgi:predicted Zn-dependent protease
VRKIVSALLILLGLPWWVNPALAQTRQKGPSIIRDAEIENTLRDYATPLLESAGLSPQAVRIILIDDKTINAFVSGGQNLFFYTGLLRETDDVGQLVGVMAHEIGHIAGGHLVRGRDAMRSASRQAMIGALLGIAAGVAAGRADVGAAVVAGSNSMAQRSVLAFTRTQESAADTAGLHFLDQNHLSAQGMLDFLSKLLGQELLPENRQVEFVRTHPLTQDRVSFVRDHVEKSPYSAAPYPEAWVKSHKRMVAKLDGFIDPARTLQRVKADDPAFDSRYARAIALYRRARLAEALPILQGLLAEEPENPFLHELQGQMLFENGHIAEAIPSYRKAVSLLPDSDLLRIGLAHVLLEGNDPAVLDEAIGHLNRALAVDREEPFTWRLMGVAQSRKGDDAQTTLALAEQAMLSGDIPTARTQAEQAGSMFATGSPGWLRAQDILVEVERQRRDREQQ